MIAKDIPSLTGIRAVAAIWIVSLHFWESFLLLLPSLVCVSPVVEQGNFGVDLFFLLSGLIMMHVYGSSGAFGRREYLQFVGRRFARIYPAYFVVLIGMIGLVLAADFFGVPRSVKLFPAGNLIFEFLMLQAWGPTLTSWNYPAWSVSAEWFSYLFVFPVALWIYRRLGDASKGKSLFGPLGALVLAGLFLSGIAISHFPEGLPYAAIRVSGEFLTGAMLYRILVAARRKSWIGNALFLGGIFLFVALCWQFLNVPGMGSWWVMMISISAILSSLGIEGSLGAKWMGRQPWIYLGQISYSLYLVHTPVQRVLKVTISAQHFESAFLGARLAIFILYLGILLGSAALVFHFVENPARHYLTRRFAVKKGDGS